MSRNRALFALWLSSTLLTGTAATAGPLTGNCRVGNQPAATLLIPYFEVDLAHPKGATTLMSVNNSSSMPQIARVVMWTDWGVPTLAFDIYLMGYDVQTLNLRDVFQGNLPLTVPDHSFAGCGNPGTGELPTTSTGLDFTYLLAAHTGKPIAKSTASQCAGSVSQDPNLVTGYVTVDVVNRCSPRSVGSTANTPADPQYFGANGTGLASDANVLWGDYYYVNSDKNTANSQTAVAVVADADFFSTGDYTFYGRYVNFDSRDDRVPLSSLYYVRYLDGGEFSGGTDVVVWRDNRRPETALRDCGTNPAWAPLGEEQLVVFDESEHPQEIPDSHAFPYATQKVHVGGPSLPVSQPFGFLAIDLWHSDGTHAQGWVSVLMTADGRFGAGNEAVRVDDLCNFGKSGVRGPRL
jgi:hypothetical protein